MSSDPGAIDGATNGDKVAIAAADYDDEDENDDGGGGDGDPETLSYKAEASRMYILPKLRFLVLILHRKVTYLMPIHGLLFHNPCMPPSSNPIPSVRPKTTHVTHIAHQHETLIIHSLNFLPLSTRKFPSFSSRCVERKRKKMIFCNYPS